MSYGFVPMSVQEHRDPPYSAAFERRSRIHDQKDALKILEREMDRPKELIVSAGIALNSILVARSDSL